MAKQFVLNRPLYTDKDKTLVLEENDPKAAFVIGGKGSVVTDADVEKYKLDDSHRLVEENEAAQASDADTTEETAVNAESDESQESDDETEGNEEVDLDSMSKAELAEHAESLGVEVKTSWSIAKIKEAIESAQAE